MVQCADRRAGDNIDIGYAVHLVAEKLNADGVIQRIGREDVDDIAADAKEINEKRQAEYDAQQIEDAKALLAAREGDAVPEAEG
jgi:hypothetical protein